MLGINELGTGAASWAAQYKVLLDEVRELQPDAIIFLQAIFHTTQEKSDATFFKKFDHRRTQRRAPKARRQRDGLLHRLQSSSTTLPAR